MKSHGKNYTWELVKKKMPSEKNVIGCKWVYCKNDALSEKESKKYQAWLVIKGYS